MTDISGVCARRVKVKRKLKEVVVLQALQRDSCLIETIVPPSNYVRRNTLVKGIGSLLVGGDYVWPIYLCRGASNGASLNK